MSVAPRSRQLAKVDRKAAKPKERRVARNMAPTAHEPHGVAFDTQLSVAAAVDDTLCAITRTLTSGGIRQSSGRQTKAGSGGESSRGWVEAL